eukprot:TRINITY_DN11452_c0_g1_i2.p1 TRINITY_DN11452_c0_g1~~TRINITY_DN11452_c0_g1_i2.p1  ORF type:complete len:203 (-),score=11.99 TRINITY_DN11452_c0_g1_i2:8-538(-)
MVGRQTGILLPRAGLLPSARGIQQPSFGGVRAGYGYSELDQMSHGLWQPGQTYSNGNQSALSGLQGLSSNNTGIDGVPLYQRGLPQFGFNGDTQFGAHYIGNQYNFVPGMEQLAQSIDHIGAINRFDHLGLTAAEAVGHADEGTGNEVSPLDTLASALSQQLPTTAEMTSAASGLF